MSEPSNSVLVQLRSGICPQLHSAEQRVADCILADARRASVVTSAELAHMSGSSEATITRLCHKLGFESYRRFQLALARDVMDLGTDGKKERSEDPVQNMAAAVITARSDELRLLLKSIDKQKLRRAAESLRAAEFIVIAAAENNVCAALDASVKFSGLGKRCVFHEVPERALGLARTLTENDLLLILSESGRSAALEQTARQAKEAGAAVLVVTREHRSPLAKLADMAFLLPRDAERKNGEKKIPSQLTALALVELLYSLMAEPSLL